MSASDSTVTSPARFPSLPVTGSTGLPPPVVPGADTLRAAPRLPRAADRSFRGGHTFAEALAQEAPWMVSGAPAPGAWRGIAFHGVTPLLDHVSLAGVAWRDPLEARPDAATFAWWPWDLAAGARALEATTALLATVPSRTLVGYELASDGARDVRAAVGGRIFGNADVVGWLTASDADRQAEGGARVEDRTEILQISGPRGTRDRVALTVLSLPSGRGRFALVDRADGTGVVEVSTVTQRRPRALDVAWSRHPLATDSLRASFSWTSNHTSVRGVLAGTAWTESANGAALRAASRWASGPLWAEGTLQRETLSYRASTPTGKLTGETVVLADTSRARFAAGVAAGARRPLGDRGEWRAGFRLTAPGLGGGFLDPVVLVRLGGPVGRSFHAGWDAGSAAPTLLEPVRRVSEAIAAAPAAFPVARAHLLRAGIASAGERGALRLEGFQLTASGYPRRDVAPYDAELAVRRASLRVSLRGVLGGADFRVRRSLLMSVRGTVLASADSVLAETERPRAVGAWMATWTGRCLGLSCGLSSSWVLAAHTPSHFAANEVPATAAWDASLALDVHGAVCVLRGENLAGRQLGTASSPFSTAPRVMASVLLRLLD